MQLPHIIIGILLSLFLFCCKQKQNSIEVSDSNRTKATDRIDAQPPKGEITTVYCKNAPAISYAFYLPTNYEKKGTYPAICFFDPQGNGKKPVNLYKDIADRYGFILIGMNNSKNGQNVNEIIENFKIVVKDVSEQGFNPGNDLVLCGFSGGARVVNSIVAVNPEYKNIIGCGAGIVVGRTFIGNAINIVGEKDFNYCEVVKIAEQNNKNHYSVLTHAGKHEWPNLTIMIKAIALIELNSERSTIHPDTLKQFEYESKSWTSTLPDLNSIDNELQQQQFFAKWLIEKDWNYWQQELTQLEKKALLSSGERLVSERALNYLGAICYSYAGAALRENNKAQAEKILKVYGRVDPTNADMFYYKSNYATLYESKRLAVEYLKKAAENGFSEIEKINSSTILAQLKTEMEFDEIYDIIENNSLK